MSINVSFVTGKTESTPKNNDRKSVKTRVFTLNILQIVFFINKVITCSAIRKCLVYQYLTCK